MPRPALAVSAFALAAVCGLSAISFSAWAQPPAETGRGNQAGYKPAFINQTRAPNLTTDTQFQLTDVVTGLNKPFAFEFLPSGSIIITERSGQFRIVTNGKLSAPLKANVPAVDSGGQGGLLDVALDPNYATNHVIYWSFSEPQKDGSNNTAVAKGRLTEGTAPKIDNVQVIYHQTPSLHSSLHFGSRIVFARDGSMFVTQGERSILQGRVQAQDLKSDLGKVVRINTDGSIPKDNPFVGRSDARPEIWSYGHRNVQGAFLNPNTGELWTMEHGPQGGDELNIARKGHDYGWPTITYGIEYPPSNAKIGEGTQKEGMDQPVYYWDPVIAPGAAMFYNASLFPKWKGSIFVSGLNSHYVARLTMDGDKVKGEERLRFSPRDERYRDIGVGPDGAIYVLTDGGGRLIRVSPK